MGYFYAPIAYPVFTGRVFGIGYWVVGRPSVSFNQLALIFMNEDTGSRGHSGQEGSRINMVLMTSPAPAVVFTTLFTSSEYLYLRSSGHFLFPLTNMLR
tara:strand:- start:102 stop:398 length:297 start_codon:yes stop_codon:yes gene_type:complete